MSELKAYRIKGVTLGDFHDVYLKSEADKVIAHHKYKRCLAMVRYYDNEVRDSIDYMRRCGGGYDAYVNAHIDKMKKRMKKWLAIAEKFKPNSTAH